MLRINKKGQTTLEYTVVIIVVVGALLAMGSYIKRGLQGRWKSAVGDLGDQYDPRAANTSVLHTMVSSTNTTILAIDQADGYWTQRTDETSSRETKSGYMSVGGY